MLCQLESEAAAAAKANDLALLAKERERQAQLAAQAAVQAEWDKRDRDLAFRIAGGDFSAVDEGINSTTTAALGASNRSSSGPSGKYAYLKSWPYTKLRETINTSCGELILIYHYLVGIYLAS
ncbi:unnamed protein product [Protopolystoma xenopodis]|uniref:Uncharacterized protein n=1 Tax=Protopolystoma xenopodis TaxID=117903 RepID=A0A448X701_9PLAT|nr:unnamed protein product [Protopolystoma xenopodis]